MGQQLTPYVLAGGLSVRMGRDKAFLPYAGTTLLEHALRRMRSLGNPVILSGDPGRVGRRSRLAAFGRTVPDRVPDAGPLGGMDAALHDSTTDWLLLMPVDQPCLPTEALERLAAEVLTAQFAGRHVLAAWFTQPESPEPLPLVLHRNTAAAVQKALWSGERKLIPTVRKIAGNGLLEVPGTPPAWFVNLNWPSDLPGTNAQLQ